MADDSLSWDLLVTDKSADGFDSFTSQMDKTTGKAKAWGKKLGAALAGATAAAGALAAKGFAENMELDQANDKLKGQLGLVGADAQKAGQVASKVYASGWGGSIDEVNEAIASVNGTLGKVSTTSQADLQDMTTKALAFSSTMGVEVPLAAETAGKLVKNGLAKNATEAFDILTTGFQNGANASDDFIDTLNEYSPQFQKLGISGAQATALIEQSLKGGARNSDVLGDALKELSLQAVAGTPPVNAAYKALGLNAKKTAEDIAAGGPAANKAMTQIITGIQNIKDPIKKNNVALAFMGTTYEELGPKAFASLNLAASAAMTTKGATDQMAASVGDNAASKIQSMQRSIDMWTASVVSTNGPLGTVATGVMAFGGGAVNAAVQVATLSTAVKGSTLATQASAIATKAWAAGQWLLNTALAANPIVLVIAAVVALGVALVVAYKKSQTFRNIVNGAFRSILAVAKAIGNGIKTAFSAVFNVLKTIVRTYVAVWRLEFNVIRTVAVTVFNAVRTVARTVWNAIKTAVSTAVTMIKGKIQDIRTKAGDVLNSIKKLFSPTALYNAGAKLITGLAKGIASKAMEPVNKVKGIMANIKGFLPGSPIKHGPLKSWNNGNAGKRLMTLLAKGISESKATVSKAVGTAVKAGAALKGIGIGTTKKASTNPRTGFGGGVLKTIATNASHGVTKKLGAAPKKSGRTSVSSGGGGGGGSLTVNIYGVQFGTPEQISKAIIGALRQYKAQGGSVPFGTFQGGSV